MSKFNLNTLYRWARTIHWISSALCLVSLLFFSLTGITLNHPDWFQGDVQEIRQTLDIADSDIALLTEGDAATRLANSLRLIEKTLGLSNPRSVEQDEDEWFFDYPAPGGYSLVTLDLVDNRLFVEQSDRGIIAYINDLHKGRHSGAVWAWFIDISALVAFIFSLSGLLILHQMARRRHLVWPITGLGLLIPVALALFFVP